MASLLASLTYPEVLRIARLNQQRYRRMYPWQKASCRICGTRAATHVDNTEMQMDFMGQTHPNRLLANLEADHRIAIAVAVASGDEDCIRYAISIHNLRYLCIPCHQRKTADDMGKLYATRSSRGLSLLC